MESDTAYGGNGFYVGNPSDFNKKSANRRSQILGFPGKKTQPEELEKLKRESNWKLKIMDRPDKLVKKYGVLRILRKGLSVDDAHFTLFYVYPLQNSMYWPIAPPTSYYELEK